MLMFPLRNTANNPVLGAARNTNTRADTFALCRASGKQFLLLLDRANLRARQIQLITHTPPVLYERSHQRALV